MSGKLFEPALAALDKPHKFAVSGSSMGSAIAGSLRLRTIISLGAAAQLALCALVSLKWAAVPATLLLSASVIKTIQQLLSPESNEFRSGSSTFRMTSQLPDPAMGGRQGPVPGCFGGNGGLVVFQLGVRSNHPLGVFAPHFREIGEMFFCMTKDMRRRRDEVGLLGASSWTANERASNNSTLSTFFFRDIDSVHRFAHGELHEKAIRYYNAERPTHIAIFHETYVVKEGGYESVYANCHPTLLGAASIRCPTSAAGQGEKNEGEAKWFNPLVKADAPWLKTYRARLRKEENGDTRVYA